jgi:hypothetical protein
MLYWPDTVLAIYFAGIDEPEMPTNSIGEMQFYRRNSNLD